MNQPIKVGDWAIIHHFCNCEFCTKEFRVQILWNEEWKGYGMRTQDGEWVSGMGMASTIQIEGKP